MGNFAKDNRGDALDAFMKPSRPSPQASSLEPKAPLTLDAYAPAQIADRVCKIGLAKVTTPVPTMMALALLAGACISPGALFYAVTVTTGNDITVPFGLLRLAGGLTFSLVLVVVSGAELFTGNNLIAMAWAVGCVRTSQVVKNWLWVYIGNLIGALGTRVVTAVPFVTPWIIEGWMRGSHYGPLMPVSVKQATPTSFDGPPRVACIGFQLADGKLIGPRDMFDDPSYDEARRDADRIADVLRLHGPFGPHRLPLEEMEYTTMPQIKKKLEGRWAKL